MLRFVFKSLLLGLICAGLLTATAHAQEKKKTSKSPSNAAGPQKLYKWVDDQGNVHYSERLPQEATGKATSTLNRQGTVTRETGRALTPEELAAKQAAERKRQDEAKAATVERRKNEAVLSSYESEKDIDLARERAMVSNADAIRSATHNVDVAAKKQAELQQRAAPFKDKPVPTKLQQEIEANAVDLKNQQQLLDTKKREAEQINARYDEDKRRFNALTKNKDSAAGGGTTTAVKR